MKLAQVNIKDFWQLSGEGGKGGFSSLADVVSNILPKILLLGALISFIIIIIAGIGVISGAGGGDAHDAESKKNILTYAIIGLVIMFGAYWILQIINFVTNGSLQSLF